jgi:hypothetical protein
MKKFMFSAIAMIAFVGSSMANTSEVKNEQIIQEEKTCLEKAMDYANQISGTDVEIHNAFVGYLRGCKDATKKTAVVPAISEN